MFGWFSPYIEFNWYDNYQIRIQIFENKFMGKL